ncbi:hypothetical protein [Thermospira aquatica]|uniref:Lipoprotein n=1 Tax=Thermospira aquatica TaxID=2828656 RepID=A0AAX3BG52_9SPIR|nr:hypothetical protein [Thermospira aquatica]URA11108.1 hypothetical protein KDW03_04745 [Thermospira aquatica]
MRKKKGIFLIGFLFIVFGFMGCSLFLGPLSRLSLEGLVQQQWQWTWVGDTGYSMEPDPAVFIQVYRVLDNDQPGFVLSFLSSIAGKLWLHSLPSDGVQAIGSFPHFNPYNDIHIDVSSDQKEVILRGVTNSDIPSYFFIYHQPPNGKLEYRCYFGGTMGFSFRKSGV